MKNRDSAVGIATGYRLASRGFGYRDPIRPIIFISLYHSDGLWVPPSLLLNLLNLSPGVKCPVREVDHSPPTSVEVKKT
jgi:hypothetical protein